MDKFTLTALEYIPKWFALIYLGIFSLFFSGFFPDFSAGSIISIVIGFISLIVFVSLFFKNRKKLNSVVVEFKNHGIRIKSKLKKEPTIISWDNITRISFQYNSESIKVLGYNCIMRAKVLKFHFKNGKIWTWDNWAISEEFLNKLRNECNLKKLEFEEYK
ncbi:MAG: hypothetical protein Q4F84_03260 [Fibrobacter sp.]|nr:hypothetical protein [Fibrobacter sp.]